MSRNMKRWTALALVLVLLIPASACGFSEHPDKPTEPTTSPTTGPTQGSTTEPTGFSTTDPTAWNPGTAGTVEVQAEQLRMSGYLENWVNRFCNSIGASVSVGSVQELETVLKQIRALGKEFSDPETYDAAFFEANFLVLIPAQSTSGSVRFNAVAAAENEKITITLTGKLNGVGTADMADWLVLVSMPKTTFDVDVPVTVVTNGGRVEDPGLNINDR